MKKQVKPNLQLMLKSTISALQVTYKDYKAAIIEDLRYTWFSDNGDLTFFCRSRRTKEKDCGFGNGSNTFANGS